jgi:hypothetical protein
MVTLEQFCHDVIVDNALPEAPKAPYAIKVDNAKMYLLTSVMHIRLARIDHDWRVDCIGHNSTIKASYCQVWRK